MILRNRTIGGKLMGGPRYDTADDIFGGASEDYAKLSGGGGNEEPPVPAVKETPDTQDVDQQGQGKEKQQPETPDKSADEKLQGEETPADKKVKEKVDGISEVRKWGKEWETTAAKHEARLKEVEPIFKLVEEKFGGEENLNFASEIYQAVANEAEFDPETALEFLSENLPGVADKLVTHITKSVIERATSTTIERTFGRKLNDAEINGMKAFLATGKMSDSNKFDAFFKSDDIPDALRLDPETGEERDPVVLDFIRQQQALLKETQAQIKSLEGKVTGADEASKQHAASVAIESYVQDNFVGIQDKIGELGLSDPIPGETPEVAATRQKYAGVLEGVALYLASKDESFQGMYSKAIQAVARMAINPKDRASRADAQDFSRRIQAKVNTFAAEAAEIMTPLLDAFSAGREKQIEKVKQTRNEPDVIGGHETDGRKTDPSADPFDEASIQAAVSDMMKSRRR